MNTDRLDSWKEIAAHLGRGVRTVQRWEKREGLPVHRHAHEKLGSVYAFKSEIDSWWAARRSDLTSGSPSGGATLLWDAFRNQRLRWLIAGVAGLLVALYALPFSRTASTPERPPFLIPLPVTTLPGSEYFPSFSPDGTQVAFSWITPGRPVDIYAKTIGSEDLRQVTRHNAADLGPAWSPDGQWIAFLRGDRIRGPRRDVLIVPSRGGQERKLGETEPDWGPFLTWTSDSSALVYSACLPPEPCRLKLVRLDTLDEQLLTFPPAGPGGDTAPSVSRDGRRLLFVRRSGGHTARVFAQRLAADSRPIGEPRAITPDEVFATSPVWSTDGRSFLYMEGEVGTSMTLWQMAPSAGAGPRLLAALGDTFFEPGLSVNRNHVMAMDLAVDTNIRKFSLGADGTFGPGVAITTSNRLDTFPHLSPDERRVAFQSTRYGGSDIFVMNADGSHVAQLTWLGLEQARTPRWRPDGAQIAFAAGRKAGDVFVVDVDGGPPRLLSGGPADESLPSWSADGRSVYFTSNRSGRDEIWAIPADGGEAIQLTRQGGYRPIASPDGAFVYYTKRRAGAPHGAPLWRVRTAGGGEEQVFERPVFHPENFDVIEGAIYYSTASGRERRRVIRIFRLDTGSDSEVADIGPAPSTGLTVSSDGSTILYSHIDSNEADLVMFAIP